MGRKEAEENVARVRRPDLRKIAQKVAGTLGEEPSKADLKRKRPVEFRPIPPARRAA